MDHASQVFLHKSAIGRIASRNMEYEGTSYKPLEFFGDAAIEFQVSRVLMNDFPGRGPGLLTWLRGRMVDNRTLGVLGWGCGLAPLIKFGKDPHLNANGGRNVSQSIVSEVFEAYIGALALDPASNTALCEWFDRVFSKNSAVFPRLQEEASTRLGHMKETVVRKTTAKEAHNAGKFSSFDLFFS
ncbi:ribonuclease III domain-containing protein [Sporobolomyces salmoneus]|uniref:ribonuclease III domain-containing protein n=1 Tax=Sporobolomyces salmoneus TaxID=183962 RepID=UPI0031775C93